MTTRASRNRLTRLAVAGGLVAALTAGGAILFSASSNAGVACDGGYGCRTTTTTAPPTTTTMAPTTTTEAPTTTTVAPNVSPTSAHAVVVAPTFAG